MLSKKQVHLSQFNGIRSYNAAMLAIDLANRVMEESQKGHLIIEDGELVTPVYSISVEDGAFSLYIELSKSVKAWIVGCERDDQNRTYTTKATVREYFNNLKIYHVIDVSTLKGIRYAK